MSQSSTPKRLSPKELEDKLQNSGDRAPHATVALRRHIEALEAELAGLKSNLPISSESSPSGQVEKDRRWVQYRLTESCVARCSLIDPLHEEQCTRATSALSRLAAKAQSYESMRLKVAALESELATAQHEVAKMDAALRVVVPEWEALFSSTCVWCGTPAPEFTTAEALHSYIREHVRLCTKHPMRALEAELAGLKANLPISSESSNSGQVAEDMGRLDRALNAFSMGTFQDGLRAALSRLAAGAQGYEAMKAEHDAWKALALRTLALSIYVHGRWSHMADLWRRAVTEGAAMRLALEAQERAFDKAVAYDTLGDLRDMDLQQQADRLRESVLSSSRPQMDAVPLDWVRVALLECPGIQRLSAEAVMEALRRAAAEGRPVPVGAAVPNLAAALLRDTSCCTEPES